MKDINIKFTPPELKIDHTSAQQAHDACAPALRTAAAVPLTTLRCNHLDGSALSPEEVAYATKLAKELDDAGNLSDDNRAWLIKKGVTWEV